MRFTTLVFLLFLVNNSLVGQVLIGKTIDENKRPISGVNILNLSNGKHTHSDDKGIFTLKEVEIGDTLHFSHFEFIDEKIVIDSLSNNQLTISLKLKSILLDEIIVGNTVDALNIIADIDVQVKPVNSSQDVLRKIPGLFIGQHAGGGKAEQIFLRGFDIDHGTDINITVDGLPVNMVSHAHGQGYADLHFVIPETVNKIDFGKGPYYANQGNFNTAGYVNFNTKQKLKNNTIKFELGQFNTLRFLSMFNLLNKEKHNSYLATEYLATDGPFESPQNFNRINIFGKYTGFVSKSSKVGIILSHFTSKWDASGQIPQRAVNNGTIGRFGAIDDTEGGNTSRTNILVNFDKFFNNNSFIKNSVYFNKYDFELFSNFTFFLEDPINGDQIKQKENRNIYGFNSVYNSSFSKGKLKAEWQTGLSLRYDQSFNNELSHTLNRKEVINPIQLGTINEMNLGAFINSTFYLGKWTFNPAIRIDYFDFQYNDVLQNLYTTQTATKSIVSPKLNVMFNPIRNLQFYLKSGKGFHSNDTRVIVSQSGKQILPSAYGFDGGIIWKPSKKWLINTAYWYLFLQQEFVYVGDAGIVEPSGKTQRHGIDVSLRFQPVHWLFWNIDFNYTNARATEMQSSESYIPLAPDFTMVSGLSIMHKSGVYGDINVRFLNDRPANENNSIIAKGYTIVDLNVGYKWKFLNTGIQIQNLFNTDWNETQFATESRLNDEIEAVEEIHFTPGTPFFIKCIIGFIF